MQTQSDHPCLKVVSDWVALLDDELEPLHAKTLWAHVHQCDVCGGFIENQKAFNSCVDRVLRTDHRLKLPDDVRSRLLKALDADEDKKDSAGTTSKANIRQLYPVGIAALLLVALSLVAIIQSGSPKDDQGTPLASYIDIRDALLAERDTMIAKLGSHDRNALEAYAQQLAFPVKVPTYDDSRASLPMDAINVSSGTVQGIPYRAICFCSGALTHPDLDPSIQQFDRHLKRFVLFMLEGKVALTGESMGPYRIKVTSTTTSVAWHERDDLTCIALTLSGVPAEEAQKMVAPVVISR